MLRQHLIPACAGFGNQFFKHQNLMNMKTDHILKADLLDIIFDNRNKNYGAYALRKFYNERLYKALGITFVFIALISLFVLLQKSEKNLLQPDIITRIVHVLPDVAKPTEKIKPPEPPAKPIPTAVRPPLNTQLFVSTVDIVDDNADATKLATNLDNVIISNQTSDQGSNGKQIINADPGPVTKTGTGTEPVKAIDKTKPLTTVEVMPAYPGGEAALIKFLQRNLQNPTDLDEGQIISVKIRFIVGYDGILKGFETVEDGGAAFNNEVIRVLKKMPAWIPGKTAGENVSVYYTIPVKFIQQD